MFIPMLSKQTNKSYFSDIQTLWSIYNVMFQNLQGIDDNISNNKTYKNYLH